MGRPGGGMRDLVQIHITDSLPIHARAVPYADRIEVRFGRAFPVALLIDRVVIDRLTEAIQLGHKELNTPEVTEGCDDER